MRIALTGHRPNKLGNEYDMDGPISNYLREEFDKILLTREPRTIISGMALGADTIWAITGLYHGIQVIAAIPFLGQEKAWPETSQWQYHQILKHKKVIPTYICGESYAAWKMQKRNEWMVDHCDLLIAVFDGSTGGTKNCMDYAEKQGKETIRIKI
jgi:uncharacterized phage-like protein YoqJ